MTSDEPNRHVEGHAKTKIITLICALLALGTGNVRAAKAPLSPEELKKEASHVITGSVLKVTSKKQKSKVERAFGSHVDRIFTITLKVKKVSKGRGVNVDDEIEIEAWTPVRRIPPLPGLQGHDSIPKKGDTVTVCAQGKKGEAYEPILPNGIVIVIGK